MPPAMPADAGDHLRDRRSPATFDGAVLLEYDMTRPAIGAIAFLPLSLSRHPLPELYDMNFLDSWPDF